MPLSEASDLEDANNRRATVFRRKSALVGKLPVDALEHVDVFIQTLKKIDFQDIIIPWKVETVTISSLSKRMRLWRSNSIYNHVFSKCSMGVKEELFIYWVDRIMSDQ